MRIFSPSSSPNEDISPDMSTKRPPSTRMPFWQARLRQFSAISARLMSLAACLSISGEFRLKLPYDVTLPGVAKPELAEDVADAKERRLSGVYGEDGVFGVRYCWRRECERDCVWRWRGTRCGVVGAATRTDLVERVASGDGGRRAGVEGTE